VSLLRTDSSQVVTFTPQMTQPLWLGQVGHVSNLVYSYSCPGGCDQLSCILMVEATVRTPAMNPGRILQVFRGASLIWEGILQEPVPGDQGWTVTAVGAGNYGTNYVAGYTDVWPAGEPDEAVNDAILRGLRWTNPGIGTTGMFLGSEVDPGDQTITDLLNLVTTYGAYTWYVTTSNYGNTLRVVPLPAAPNRLLVATTPVPRTLGGDVNTIFAKYVISSDNSTTGAAEVDGVGVSTNPASIALYGAMEAYIDLTQAGAMSAATAEGYGNNVLSRFIHATYGGSFQVGPNQLLTMGGQPVDIGADQAATVCQLVFTDYAFGGEVTPFPPPQFLVGEYSYDDDAQTATVTAFSYLGQSISDMLQAASTTLPSSSQ
jgi:hypothetical protein